MRKIGVLLLTVVLLGTSCGGNDETSGSDPAQAPSALADQTPSDEADAAEEESPSPEEKGGVDAKPVSGGKFGPGTFVTKKFSPQFTFTTHFKGDVEIQLPFVFWFGDATREPVSGHSTSYGIGFLAMRPTDSPDEVAAYVRGRFTKFDPSPLKPTTLGDLKGHRFDVVVEEHFKPFTGDFAPFGIDPGEKYSFFTTTIAGETITVFVHAPPGDYDGFVPEADKVLSTVEAVE